MSVDPEIFAIFQHKVERIPHFARVTEVRHILFNKYQDSFPPIMNTVLLIVKQQICAKRCLKQQLNF